MKGVFTLLIAICIFGMWACRNSSHPEHIISDLEDAPVLRQWSISLDSLPGIMDLYHFSSTDEEGMSVVAVCYDLISKKSHHYLLSFSDNLERTGLTKNPIPFGSYFISKDEFLRVLSPGDLLSIENTGSGKVDSVRLTDNQYFARSLRPLLLAGKVFVQAVDLSYELRDHQQNELFFKETHPIIILDSAFRVSEYAGNYPPDYSEKHVYGYHLSPALDEDGGAIYLSFPGSRYIGRINPNQDNTSFSELYSAYDVNYEPMDTAAFMQIGKAIQFQDTVSRYLQVCYSAKFKKVARIYKRHKPINFNGEIYGGSVVVGNTVSDLIEVEYLVDKEKFRPSRMLLVEKGLLLMEYVKDENDAPLINFSLLSIYEN